MKKLLLITVVLALVMLMSISTVILAASVTPTVMSGNPTADDLGLGDYYSYKVDPPESGIYDQDGHYLEWTISEDGKYLDFQNASPGIIAVIVKGGKNGANVYKYGSGGEVTYDNDLTTPLKDPDDPDSYQEISHIIFIWGTGGGVVTPELPAGALLGLGLAGVGAIVLISRRRETASAR